MRLRPSWRQSGRQRPRPTIDDTNTMFLEFRHVTKPQASRRRGGPIARSCSPARSPRNPTRPASGTPATTKPQVSQRPIAIHGLEPLGATDRGVTMFRNQIRRGIRAVRTGDEPPGLCHTTGAVTPTYCNDTVVRAPPAEAPPAADARDRAAAGRGLSQGSAADDGAAEAGGGQSYRTTAERLISKGLAKNWGGQWPPRVNGRADYIGQIFQITPVPGIWTSGPSAAPR